LKGTFQFLRYDKITLHTCFKFNQVSLLNTKLFLEFQIPQRTAEEMKLNCRNFLLQSHLLAMGRNVWDNISYFIPNQVWDNIYIKITRICFTTPSYDMCRYIQTSTKRRPKWHGSTSQSWQKLQCVWEVVLPPLR
jgi:hypothetical protein